MGFRGNSSNIINIEGDINYVNAAGDLRLQSAYYNFNKNQTGNLTTNYIHLYTPSDTGVYYFGASNALDDEDLEILSNTRSGTYASVGRTTQTNRIILVI